MKGKLIQVLPFALLLIVPLSLSVGYLTNAPATWVFLAGLGGIGVLADWVRRATEQLARIAGSTIGSLLNVSFGNSAELVLAFFVLARARSEVARRRSPARSSEQHCCFLASPP